jgi:hypothetical protein
MWRMMPMTPENNSVKTKKKGKNQVNMQIKQQQQQKKRSLWT